MCTMSSILSKINMHNKKIVVHRTDSPSDLKGKSLGSVPKFQYWPGHLVSVAIAGGSPRHCHYRV